MGWLLSLISSPLLGKLVDAYKAKLDASNDKERIAADLAAKDLELQAKERELNVEIAKIDSGSFWTAAPRAIVCWSIAIYISKVIVVDTVLGWGSTVALKGMLAEWAGYVVIAWFGGRSAEKIARILRPR